MAAKRLSYRDSARSKCPTPGEAFEWGTQEEQPQGLSFWA